MKRHLVVLTGAGISAESGLQTFRDSNGLWENYRIEDVATLQAWQKNPQLVLQFYNFRRQQVREAKPNGAHLALAALEKQYEVSIITQNIDDLHERAGSTNVLHLHGEIFKKRSVTNENLISTIYHDINLGDIAEDGAQYRPHIVWFGEPVPMIEKAADVMQTADIFVLIGSSMQVYPAAGLLYYLPKNCPKFVIDKSAPLIEPMPYLTMIEKIATEGIEDLLNVLK